MTTEEVERYLDALEDKLVHKTDWRRFFSSRAELQGVVPNKPGVYVFKDEDGDIVYVGETGNLYGRMKDLFDTRNHNLRRSIGRTFYSGHDTFASASASRKFDSITEQFVTKHLCEKLFVSFIEVPLGRKELETRIKRKIKVGKRLNIRSERK